MLASAGDVVRLEISDAASVDASGCDEVTVDELREPQQRVELGDPPPRRREVAPEIRFDQPRTLRFRGRSLELVSQAAETASNQGERRLGSDVDDLTPA